MTASTINTCTRYHDISCGHRVHGHESKCSNLHGHNYRIHFTARAPKLDAVGRVIDFGLMRTLLCDWLEDNWDHRFLAWDQDHIMRAIDRALYTQRNHDDDSERCTHSVVWVPFNPTAENIAEHLLNVMCPRQLVGTGIEVVEVRVEETMKCSATATTPQYVTPLDRWTLT